MKRLLCIASMWGLLLSGCDDSSTNVVGDGDGGNNPGIDGGPGDPDGNFVDFSDADPNAPDAGVVPCGEGQPQCNNCLDDDNDNLVDGLDPECAGAIDNDEASFATGIPGDNIDPKSQDCFFDGNSGGGDDKCKFHTCCILNLTQQPDMECPAALQPPNFNPDDCELSQECINNCSPLTPPGCDCFGCCTICDDDSCRDIYTNPAVSVGCTLETLDDPMKCMACVKTEECGGGGECDNANCELCPGQTVDDLPEECNETPACPNGNTVCTTTADCAGGEYCSVGCCIASIG